MLDARSALARLGLAAALALLAAAPAPARECGPWPSEPAPLPRVDDRDPLRARWAELRAKELAQRALALETSAPAAAWHVWDRVLCLDPDDEAARAGAQRSRPLRLYRPEIRLEPEPPAAALDTDVWTALAAPVWIGAARPLPARAPEPGTEAAPVSARAESLRRIDGWLARAQAQVDAARFEEALATSARARSALGALARGRDLASRRLRLELVEATAEAASGREEAARACFARALALDPSFALDPRTTSPKLLRLLDAARLADGATP